MTRTFLLAHLSDIHLGPLPRFALRHWNVKRTLGYLNWQRGRRHVHTRAALDLVTADVARHKPHHIAVTGDLVNIALPGEYEAATAWLEKLGAPRDVSVIPGNHDIYTHMGDDPGCARWAAYMCGDGAVPAADELRMTFPYVRRRGPCAIVGLNSGVPTRPFVAAGEIGEVQRDRLPAILDALAAEGLFRVVLIHHPPLVGQAAPVRGLRDAPQLEGILDRHGAEIVLHGHNHRDSLLWRSWRGKRFPVIGIATASAARPHHGEPLARYNLIEIAREGSHFEVRIRTRGLADDGSHVIDIARTPWNAAEGAGAVLTTS